MSNPQNIAPDVSGMDPAATGQQVDVLVSQVSELVTALREAIPLLENAQNDEMPYIAVIPTDDSSQGTALLIPTESMDLDQEKIFKRLAKAVKKIDLGKVMTVVNTAVQGTPSGMAAGAVVGALGGLVKGLRKKRAPTPAMQPPAPTPIAQPLAPTPITQRLPAPTPAMQPPAPTPIAQPLPAPTPAMQPPPAASQPAPAPMAGIDIAQLAQQLVPLLSQTMAGTVPAPAVADPAVVPDPGDQIAVEAHVMAPPCAEYHHHGLASHAEHFAEDAGDEEGFEIGELVVELQRMQEALLESLPEGGSFVWARD
jgi:hypothetical protein